MWRMGNQFAVLASGPSQQIEVTRHSHTQTHRVWFEPHSYLSTLGNRIYTNE